MLVISDPLFKETLFVEYLSSQVMMSKELTMLEIGELSSECLFKNLVKTSQISLLILLILQICKLFTKMRKFVSILTRILKRKRTKMQLSYRVEMKLVLQGGRCFANSLELNSKRYMTDLISSLRKQERASTTHSQVQWWLNSEKNKQLLRIKEQAAYLSVRRIHHL